MGLIIVAVAALGTACSGDDGAADTASLGSNDQEIGSAPGTRSAARAAGTPGSGASVAKSAFAAMEVPKDELSSSAQAVIDLATSPGTGGFLVSSVFDSQEGHGSAQVQVKVPSARFEPVIGKLDGIGEVTRQELEGQDMSPQVLDAHANLQRARAGVADLIRQLEATDDEALAFELRQQARTARARLRSAQRDSTAIGTEVAFAAIEVALRATPPPPPPDKPVVERALGTAKAITVGIASGTVLVAAVLVPVLALALLVYLVGVLLFRRLKPRLQGWPG